MIVRLRSGWFEHEPSRMMSWLLSQVSVQSQIAATGGMVVTPFDRIRMSQPVANAPLWALLPTTSDHEPSAAWRRTRSVARPTWLWPGGV